MAERRQHYINLEDKIDTLQNRVDEVYKILVGDSGGNGIRGTLARHEEKIKGCEQGISFYFKLCAWVVSVSLAISAAVVIFTARGA